MNGLMIILGWILLSYPIVKHVNDRLEERDDEVRFSMAFQILLFLRAQLEVPRYYLINLYKLFSK